MKRGQIVAIKLLWLLTFLSLPTVQISQAQVTVTVTPAQADVLVNQTQQFVAKVSGIEDQRVSWRVIPQGNGTFGPGVIDATGLYTAPNNGPEPPFVTIEARSIAVPFAAIGTGEVIVRDLHDFGQSNADGDLNAINRGDYLQIGWGGLPDGTAKIVLSRSTSSNGPWTEVLIGEHPDDLTFSGTILYMDPVLVPPDTANDYFYKLEAFSATNELLQSYAPVFVPKYAGVRLTVSPTSIPPGGTIMASWSGIATPTPTDWLALYAPRSADTAYIDWLYVSCSKTPGSAQASGSCPFVVPALAPGIYEMRLFPNDSFTHLAFSNGFTVQP